MSKHEFTLELDEFYLQFSNFPLVLASPNYSNLELTVSFHWDEQDGIEDIRVTRVVYHTNDEKVVLIADAQAWYESWATHILHDMAPTGDKPIWAQLDAYLLNRCEIHKADHPEGNRE